MILWHKPFCADLSPTTFSSILQFLEKQGLEMAVSSSNENQAVLTGFLLLLSNHFVLAAESNSGSGKEYTILSADQKVSLERILYRLVPTVALIIYLLVHDIVCFRFVDLPNCSESVLRAIKRCLDLGTPCVLRPSLQDRLSRACSLLSIAAPSAGQQLNLKLLLRSLDDADVRVH